MTSRSGAFICRSSMRTIERSYMRFDGVSCFDTGHAINLEEPDAFNRAAGVFLHAFGLDRWR